MSRRHSHHGSHDLGESIFACGHHSHSHSHGLSRFGDIRSLLKLYADDDDMRVTLVLSVEACEESVIENAQIIGVKGDMVAIRRGRSRGHEHEHEHSRCHCGEIEFIKICCICAVKVCCEDMLEELLEGGRDED